MAEMQTAGAVATTTGQSTLSLHLGRQTALVIAGSALVALCAHVSLPLLFTPVPLTLQNFAVLLLGLLMEPAAVFASMALYLIEGASGLPVFTPHGPGGLLQLLGPSGGFLLAYPFIGAFVSLLSRRIRPVTFTALAFSCGTASILLYLFGAAWFKTFTHLSLGATVKLAVLPFVPGDAVKVAAAAGIAIGLATFRKRHGAGRAV